MHRNEQFLMSGHGTIILGPQPKQESEFHFFVRNHAKIRQMLYSFFMFQKKAHSL